MAYRIVYTDKTDGKRNTVFETDYEALIERLNRLRNKIDVTRRILIENDGVKP